MKSNKYPSVKEVSEYCSVCGFPRREWVNGVDFPAGGHSSYDKVCACGLLKFRETDSDHYIYICSKCDEP